MTKAQLKKNSKEIEIEMYERYKAGKISKDDYTMWMLDLLSNYIKSRISNMPHKYYEDLYVAGQSAIIAQIDKYDPHAARPTSYFTSYIDEYTHTELRDQTGLTTQHYETNRQRLKKAAREYGYEGLNDPNLTPETLHIISGVALKTVCECLIIDGVIVDSLEACSENQDYMGTYKTPEQAVMEKQSSDFLESQLKKCTPLERFLLEERVMSDEPESFRSLVIMLKQPEWREFFKNELPNGVDQVTLEQKLNHALRRIQQNTSTKKFAYVNGVDNFNEQASAYDIDEAFAEGAI